MVISKTFLTFVLLRKNKQQTIKTHDGLVNRKCIMFILISTNEEDFIINVAKFKTFEEAQTQMNKEFDDIVDDVDGNTEMQEKHKNCAIVQVDGFSTWWSIEEV